jgi:hypothetical protein
MRLERDFAVYREALPGLLARGERGRYALVHSGRLDSVWESLDQARDAGCQRFGDAPFLVLQIVAPAAGILPRVGGE